MSSPALDKALLLAHAVAAGVLVGASTHLALQALAAVRGTPRARLLRVYPPVALAAWAVVFALGAVMYPTYRIAIRRDYLDTHAVWAAALFDLKENLAIFVGPLLAGAWWTCRAIPDADRTTRLWFLAMCATAAGISWWNLLSGLLVTSVRSL